jgi:hypothetical protein
VQVSLRLSNAVINAARDDVARSQTRLHALAGIQMGGAAFPFHVATDGIGHRCAHQFAGEIFFQRSLGLPRGED